MASSRTDVMSPSSSGHNCRGVVFCCCCFYLVHPFSLFQGGCGRTDKPKAKRNLLDRTSARLYGVLTASQASRMASLTRPIDSSKSEGKQQKRNFVVFKVKREPRGKGENRLLWEERERERGERERIGEIEMRIRERRRKREIQFLATRAPTTSSFFASLSRDLFIKISRFEKRWSSGRERSRRRFVSDTIISSRATSVVWSFPIRTFRDQHQLFSFEKISFKKTVLCCDISLLVFQDLFEQ